MKEAWINVAVNGIEWTESSRRKELPCGGCQKPTRGRVEKKPFCMDCGMKKVMQPIQAVGKLLRGWFA
jgi:hypothetical protein